MTDDTTPATSSATTTVVIEHVATTVLAPSDYIAARGDTKARRGSDPVAQPRQYKAARITAATLRYQWSWGKQSWDFVAYGSSVVMEQEANTPSGFGVALNRAAYRVDDVIADLVVAHMPRRVPTVTWDDEA